ncbi:MAG: glutaredoxin family protein [Propionivibrio sp.]
MTRLLLALLTAVLLTATLALAETTTYQWLDPVTGGTVISDHEPPPGARQVIKWTGSSSTAGSAEHQLPYATQQASEKYPVTLYTTASCVDACKQARDLLNARGVPFSEQMLKSDEEIAELTKKLGSPASVPSVFVGHQSFRGFELVAWNNLLDLAGYPKTAPFGAKPSGAFSE